MDTTLNNVLLNNSKRVKQRSNKRERQRQKQRQREGEREEHGKPTKLELNPQLERKWIYIPSTNISLTFLIIRGEGGFWRAAKLYYIILEWPLITCIIMGNNLLLTIF